MAVKFPYATTVHGLTAALRQLRSAFPTKVNADTLKKWNVAVKNESSIVQTLRFLNLINDEGDKNAEAAKAFLQTDGEFEAAFSEIVKKAYSDLFETFGDEAWKVDKNKLIGYFRTSDDTSARVGEQQTATFLALAEFAGHGAAPTASSNGARRARATTTRAPRATKSAVGAPRVTPASVPPAVSSGPLPLSLRIELNLPVTDDQSVYDKIFRSIRENLIHA